jgi:hypothetical protein
MNNGHPKQIFEQLQQLGLIQPSATSDVNKSSVNNFSANEQNERDETPWFLHLFFGFSGVVASLFLVGFLTLILYQADVFESFALQLVVGILLSGVAFALFKNKNSRNNTFWNSLAFALSGAGQLYLIFALFGNEFINNISHPLSVWLLLLLQILMLIIMPNIVHRLLSCMLALGCVVYLLGFYHLPEVNLGLLAIIASVVNLQRYQLLQSVPIKWRSAGFSISKAIAYASALMLLLFSVYIVAGEYSSNGFISNDFSYNYFLAQGLLVIASLYAAYLILKRYRIKLLSQSGIVTICATMVLGLVSVYVSGLLAASLVIVIAIANSQRVLLGLGIFALVSYVFWYYYQLDTSLLVKSGSMLIMGMVMLLMRWLLVSRYFSATKSINSKDISIDSSVDNQEHLS